MNLTEVIVSRTIPASCEKVFDAWIDPKSPGGPWFGANRLIFNPSVDGLFYFSVKREGRAWLHYGRFLQINRPVRLEYTWVSEATQGIESIVAVTFDARGEETEITLRHLGVPDDKRGLQHQEGWMRVLSALADQFAANSADSTSS